MWRRDGLGLAGVPHQSGGGGRYAVPCAVKLTPEIRNKPEKDMKKIRLTASVAVLTAAVAAPSFAADVTLKFGHVGKPGSLFEASVNAYAQCVSDESTARSKYKRLALRSSEKIRSCCRS